MAYTKSGMLKGLGAQLGETDDILAQYRAKKTADRKKGKKTDYFETTSTAAGEGVLKAIAHNIAIVGGVANIIQVSDSRIALKIERFGRSELATTIEADFVKKS